ncbi:MAG: MFS transporter [Synechococcus sp.]|nr:MFS transporter [Synechococcus sp.]
MGSSLVQWALAQFFFCLNLAGVVTYAVTASSLQATLKLTTGQIGTLGGAYFMAYALSQLLLGSSLGALPARLLLGITALISASGALLLSFAGSFEIALIARLLMGIGFGTAMVGVVFVVAQRYSKKFAFMVNLSQSVANAVGAALGLLAPLPLLQNFRTPFLLTAILLVVNGVLLLLFMQEGKDESTSGEERPLSLGQKLSTIVSNGQFWLGTIYFTGLFGAFLAYADLWNIKFQMDVFGLSSSVAPIVNASAATGLTIGCVVTGAWANRIGYLLPARVCGWLSLVFILVLYSAPLGQPRAIPLMACLGFTLGAAPLGLAVMNAHVPARAQSLASPILLTVVFLGGGVLMSGVGMNLASLPASAFSTYQAGLKWFIVPIAMAAVSSLFMKPQR